MKPDFTLFFNCWSPSVLAVGFGYVCQFHTNSDGSSATKYSEFGKYVSALKITSDGATLDGWAPVWCFGQPVYDAKHILNDGFFEFSVSDARKSQNKIILINTEDARESIPLTLCMGKSNGSLNGSCVSEINGKSTIQLNTSEAVESFANSVLPTKDKSKNPSYFGYEWRIATHASIPRGTTPIPGIYAGEIGLQLRAKFTGYFNAGIADFYPLVDGDASFKNNYRVYIHKDCQFNTPGNINFTEANFVKKIPEATGQLKITCTRNTDYTIRLSGKNDLNNNHDIHYMVKQGTQEKIPYTLYHGDGSTAWQYQPPSQFTGTGVEQSVAIKARVNPGADEVTAGDYSDTITAELVY